MAQSLVQASVPVARQSIACNERNAAYIEEQAIRVPKGIPEVSFELIDPGYDSAGRCRDGAGARRRCNSDWRIASHRQSLL